jgi:hypothetical protein
MTWALVLWSILFALLLLATVVALWLEPRCSGRLCEDESATNAAFLAILFATWFLGFLALGAIGIGARLFRARRRRS